jgi:excisionase family DNA binding protein
MSVAQAANYLGISVALVRKLVRERLLPHYRLQDRIILSRDDLDAYLLAQRVPSRTTEDPTA